jgi:small subunit ribosomal protein S16
MSLKIRLARGGSKKNAHYRVVVLESTKARDGRATDIIGHYHPTVHDEKRFVVDAEKLNKWLSCGALPTETIARLCIANGMQDMKKYLPIHGESKNKGIKKKDLKQQN